MALGNTFKLEKLTIQAFEDSARQKELKSSPTGSSTLEAMYNPETLSVRHESVYRGEENKVAIWAHSRSKTLNVKLVLDGTHVSHFGAEQLRHIPTVQEQIQTFLGLCYNVVSATHEPAYLRLTWGQGVLGPKGFECRLKSVDINYTSFDRDGSPLRAELSVVFVESLDPPTKTAEERLESPDVTHRRLVRAGDTLPLLCREVYGSAIHCPRVARVNGLDSFRSLTVGQELIFPPFARKGRR